MTIAAQIEVKEIYATKVDSVRKTIMRTILAAILVVVRTLFPLFLVFKPILANGLQKEKKSVFLDFLYLL